MDKRMSLEEAAAQIPSNCTLALGGMTLYRRPVAFVKSLIRHHLQTGEPDDLTLLAFTASIESDLLVGTGMISRIRSCYFGLEIFGLAPMFTYYANRGEIEIIEETEASLAFGIRAQMAGVGFMPGRGWLGTDLPKLRPDVQSVIDPYSGEELIAFPAIKPDIAVIHALQVDFDGNADIGKNKGVDEELSIIADTVIITAEEIVPELSKANIVAPFVDAIVLAPNGAKPTSCHPKYPMDGNSILDYSEQVNDPTSFTTFIQRELT
ncbi:MAG: CoA transferase subunit A [Anaerolineales bacterium]|nr:CoA transferase subunit A [Anaerolineales bacterium]